MTPAGKAFAYGSALALFVAIVCMLLWGVPAWADQLIASGATASTLPVWAMILIDASNVLRYYWIYLTPVFAFLLVMTTMHALASLRRTD